MITASVNLSKVNQSLCFTNKKGEKILDIVLREHASDYDDDGFVAQSVKKADREAGKKGEILGNWRDHRTNKPKPKKEEDPFE